MNSRRKVTDKTDTEENQKEISGSEKIQPNQTTESDNGRRKKASF